MELRGLTREISSNLNPGKDFMFETRVNMPRCSFQVTNQVTNQEPVIYFLLTKVNILMEIYVLEVILVLATIDASHTVLIVICIQCTASKRLKFYICVLEFWNQE